MSLDKKHILLVEDDTMLSSLLASSLEKEGYEVAVANNGEEAVSAIEAKGFSIIVLDLIMPKMDGFEFLEALVKNKGENAPPAIVLSNLAQDVDVSKTEALGVVKHIVKTEVSIKQIIEEIQAVIGS